MTINLRPRDPGLQPERTALAWHRTTFSVFVLALAATRIGFARSDLIAGWLGGVAMGLAIMLMITSWFRQRQVVMSSELTTPSSLMIKRLLSVILGLEALSLALPATLKLIQTGVI